MLHLNILLLSDLMVQGLVIILPSIFIIRHRHVITYTKINAYLENM